MAWSGAWVPSQTEAEWCWWEHQILAARPVVCDKGSGPLALQKRIPIRWKVLKQVFIKRKKSTICVDREADSEGESPSCTLVEVWIIFMRYFFQVSFRQSFWFACFIVHSCYISGSSHVCTHDSWSTWILLKRFMGRTSLTSTPFGLQGAFLCMCGREGLPTWRMRNTRSRQGPASSLNCPLFVSSSFSPQGISNRFILEGAGHLPPTSVCIYLVTFYIITA